MPAQTNIPARLEELRAAIHAENISMGEILELQGLAAHIAPGDVELLEWAGVPEYCAGCGRPAIDRDAPGEPCEYCGAGMRDADLRGPGDGLGA
jgi:hypothetical protein